MTLKFVWQQGHKVAKLRNLLPQTLIHTYNLTPT